MPPRRPTPETPTEQLASVLIGEPVVVWTRQRLAAGKSWRAIARDLSTMTKGRVNVPHQTIIGWCARHDARNATTEGTTPDDQPDPAGGEPARTA